MRWVGVAIVGCWLAVSAAPASAGDRWPVIPRLVFTEAVAAYNAGDYQKVFGLVLGNTLTLYWWSKAADQSHARAQKMHVVPFQEN